MTAGFLLRKSADGSCSRSSGSFALTVVFGSWYTVDQTERGVILRNGAIVGVAQPGLGFKMPWDRFRREGQRQDMDLLVGQDGFLFLRSAAGSPKVSVTLHASPDKIADLYSRFGTLMRP
jgi:hypothetical protein